MPRTADHTVATTMVHVEGEVSRAERAYANRKLAAGMEHATAPVLLARLDLRKEADPARERPAIAAARLDVDGHLVRARAEAPTMTEAVDLLESRLRRRLERLHRRGRPRR